MAQIRMVSGTDAARILQIDHNVQADGRGTVHDADQLPSQLEVATRIDALFAAQAAGQACTMLVAETVEGVVGYAHRQALFPARIAHVGILDLSVDPAHQRQGHGRALMEAIMADSWEWGLLRLELYVRADNNRAIALYRSLGFAHEATRHGFIRLADGRLVDDHIFCLWNPTAGMGSG